MKNEKRKPIKRSAKTATAKATKGNAKSAASASKSGSAKGSTAETAPDGQVFKVASAGGPVSTVSREDAVKDCVSGGVFNAETVNEMLDANDTAFSSDYYYSLQRSNLAKWASDEPAPAAETASEAKTAAVVSSDLFLGSTPPEAFEALKKQYPDEVMDIYPDVEKAAHAFMLGDDGANERVLFFQMKENDPFSITETTLHAVKENIGKKYTAKSLMGFVERNVAFGGNDDLRFAQNRDTLLADYEKRSQPEPEDAEAPKAIANVADKKEIDILHAGDRVRNIVTKAEGVVVDKKGSLAVEVPKAKKGSGTKLVDLTEAWEKVEAAPTEALAKVESAPPAPVEIKPLTAKEKTRLEKLERAVLTAKDALDNAPFVMGAALDEIRQGKLYRETEIEPGKFCQTFGEYAELKFGITREYAQNIAQISGYVEVANEALEGGSSLAMSVNVANAMVRDTNKLAKSLEIGKADVQELKPMIVAATSLLIDIAPKAEDGSPVITPRLVEAFNEKLREHIHDGVVEIDGKQMTVAAAKEKGLLNASLREEVITATAEGILAKGELIKSEAKDAYERQNAPVTNGGDRQPSGKPDYWTGKVPELTVDCSSHGAKPITSIGNGRFQTGCGCRWHIDAESGALVCFEVKGKRVKR